MKKQVRYNSRNEKKTKDIESEYSISDLIILIRINKVVCYFFVKIIYKIWS